MQRDPARELERRRVEHQQVDNARQRTRHDSRVGRAAEPGGDVEVGVRAGSPGDPTAVQVGEDSAGAAKVVRELREVDTGGVSPGRGHRSRRPDCRLPRSAKPPRGPPGLALLDATR